MIIQGFNTMWLLMAQYDGRAMIPAEIFCSIDASSFSSESRQRRDIAASDQNGEKPKRRQNGAPI